MDLNQPVISTNESEDELMAFEQTEIPLNVDVEDKVKTKKKKAKKGMYIPSNALIGYCCLGSLGHC